MSVLSSVLGPNLRGLYAFGSAVDGGLRPASDLDFLAVVDRSLDDNERLNLARALSAISGRRAGGRSLEVVVVVADRLRPWTYPPTADFLYGDWLRDQLLATPGRPVANATLAIDLHQALSTGVVLLGEPLSAHLDPVPAGDLVRASMDGVDSLLDNLPGDTRNVLLTLARAWHTCVTGQLAPKDVAADWALPRLPIQLRAPLAHARHLYLTCTYADETWPNDVRDLAAPLAAHFARAIRAEAGQQPGRDGWGFPVSLGRTDTVVFEITAEDPAEIVPVVNGRSLIDLVADFEKARRWELAGDYSGLVPASFSFGDLTQYYLGRAARQWPGPGRAWLLGCDCGEVGCWPFDARIDVTDDLVLWQDFHQPHRAARDYRSFGPLVFDRSEYDRAVADAVAALGADRS